MIMKFHFQKFKRIFHKKKKKSEKDMKKTDNLSMRKRKNEIFSFNKLNVISLANNHFQFQPPF